MAPPPQPTRSGPIARFRAPTRRSESLIRPRVSAAIAGALKDRSFCIVTAPSGYGKTTAAADWGAEVDRLAWLTLNRLDSDPQRLARGVIDALSIASDAESGAITRPATRITPHRAYTAIVDALASWDGVVHLVVDDAQRAGEHWRDGLLGMLLEQTPDNLRLVLVGTTLLEITSSRERISEPGAFVGTGVLRMNADEIAALHSARPSDLAPDTILDETQGWPIAVTMLMIGGARPDSAAASAATFLTDYVRDYVLGAVPDGLADFVVDATACGELDPPLAAAVTQRQDAGRLLEECVRLGLFLDRFTADQGTTYRWHASFARTCDAIRTGDPVRAAAAHRRAAEHLQESEPIAAIAHALHAGDVDHAHHMLRRRWLGQLARGNAIEVESAATGLLRRLPDDPGLLLIRACASDALGEHHLARDLLDRASALVSERGESPDGTVLDIARLSISDDQDQVAEASSRVRALLANGDEVALSDQVAVNLLLGEAELRHPTNPALPAEHFAAAARELRDENPEQWARAAGELALAHVWAGRFRASGAVLESVEASRALASGPRAGGTTGPAAIAAGVAALWTGDAEAVARIVGGLALGDDADPSISATARMMGAFAAAEGGDISACRRAAIAVQEIPVERVKGVAWGVLRETSIAVLEEAIGNQERAVRIARKHVHLTDMPLVGVALAGVLRRAEQYSEALVQLRSLRVFAEVPYVKVSMLITAAVMRRQLGDHDAAHDLCEAALAVALPEGIRLPFGPRETAVRRLLGEHVHFGTRYEDFIGECLASGVAGTLTATLSEREQEVFRQLQTSRTLPEIARELGVSINTVKTHQRSIYRKLDVSSRRDAVRTTM